MYLENRYRNGYKRLYKSGKYWIAAGVAAIGLSLPLIGTSQTKADDTAPVATTSLTTDTTTPAKTVVVQSANKSTDVNAGTTTTGTPASSESKGSDLTNNGAGTQSATAESSVTPEQEGPDTKTKSLVACQAAGQSSTSAKADQQQDASLTGVTKTMVDAVAAPTQGTDPSVDPAATQQVDVTFAGVDKDDPVVQQTNGPKTSYTLYLKPGDTIGVTQFHASDTPDSDQTEKAAEEPLVKTTLYLHGYYVDSVDIDGTTTSFANVTSEGQVPNLTLTVHDGDPVHTLTYNMKHDTYIIETNYTNTDGNGRTLKSAETVPVAKDTYIAQLTTVVNNSQIPGQQLTGRTTLQDMATGIMTNLAFQVSHSDGVQTLLNNFRTSTPEQTVEQILAQQSGSTKPADIQDYVKAVLPVMNEAYTALKPQLANDPSTDANFIPNADQSNKIASVLLLWIELGMPVSEFMQPTTFGPRPNGLIINQVYAAVPDTRPADGGTTNFPGGNPTDTTAPTDGPEKTPTGTKTIPTEPATTPETQPGLPATGGTLTNNSKPDAGGKAGTETNRELPSTGGKLNTRKSRSTQSTPRKLSVRSATTTRQANELPQTGDSNHSALAAIGMALAGAMAFISFGVVRRRQH